MIDSSHKTMQQIKKTVPGVVVAGLRGGSGKTVESVKLNNRSDPTQFVSKLAPLTLEWLSLIEHSSEEKKRTKVRAQAIRLSDAKHSLYEIAKICQVTRETVSGWIDQWEKHEFDSLLEESRTGKKSIIPQEKHAEIKDIATKIPKKLRNATPKFP